VGLTTNTAATSPKFVNVHGLTLSGRQAIFAVICGGAPLDVIRRYIENRETPYN
jgi:hypothetical protein